MLRCCCRRSVEQFQPVPVGIAAIVKPAGRLSTTVIVPLVAKVPELLAVNVAGSIHADGEVTGMRLGNGHVSDAVDGRRISHGVVAIVGSPVRHRPRMVAELITEGNAAGGRLHGNRDPDWDWLRRRPNDGKRARAGSGAAANNGSRTVQTCSVGRAAMVKPAGRLSTTMIVPLVTKVQVAGGQRVAAINADLW